jgi:hypothetical protein
MQRGIFQHAIHKQGFKKTGWANLIWYEHAVNTHADDLPSSARNKMQHHLPNIRIVPERADKIGHATFKDKPQRTELTAADGIVHGGMSGSLPEGAWVMISPSRCRTDRMKAGSTRQITSGT